MVRVITQETYDEVVKENIDEFDMTPEEAVKEAIAQFEAQGVDLSNIIKDLAISGGDDHLVSVAIKKLKELATSDVDKDAEIQIELEILKIECNKGLAHRMKASKEGAYTILIDMLEKRQKNYITNKSEKDKEFIVNVWNALVALMDTQPDLLDNRGLELIKSTLDNIDNEDILTVTLRWASTCCIRHEQNRQKLFAKDIGRNLKELLNTKNVKLLSENLQLVRKMTLDDDIRVEFGKAHEHARELGGLMLEPLTKLLCENTKPPLVSELMLTISCLLVRHELCALVAQAGDSVLFTVLHDNYDNTAVLRQASKLITALAGNDDVKRSLVKSGIVPVLISVLPRHSGDESASALILKSIAALTLRESQHGKQFLENGAPEVIVECMKKHPESATVQKNACWAIRNMVARCREYNSKFHELDVESLLNQAYERFNKDFGFDMKSALRDLECDVKLDEQWTGKGVQIANDV